ncbi:hypothetical protein GOBAR_AA29707 [Gossypium barbadense]|uniref:Uncharacterized protein n=1 Tax=Gossypium barbadense TaxID=3634 RepID=A0A2P5WIS7_GOSBA|nr:hypothetical protein GOBAR_AA29707 [Gossypium barbadense]
MASPSLSEDTAKAVLRQMRSHLNLRDVKAEEVPEATLNVVAETLRTSSSLRVSEDGKKVGRSTALLEPEELLEQLDSRTIAASPFEFNVKMEAVEAFFGQYAKVNSVRLPRHVANKKYFCGTALIEFSAEEDAQKVLEQSLVYAGAELELKLKYPKGLVVAFALKNISGGDAAEKNGSDEPAKDGATEKNEEKTAENDEDNKDKVDDKQPVLGDETENKSPVQKDEGTEHKNTASVFKDDMNVVLREDLKEAFQKFGTVKYVDFKAGEEKGYIRFDESEAAQKARAAAVLANEGGLVVKNFIATLEPVTENIGVYFGVTKKSTVETSASKEGEESTSEAESVAGEEKTIHQTKLEEVEGHESDPSMHVRWIWGAAIA